MGMSLTVLDTQAGVFSLSGVCPHCGHDSVFTIVSGPVADPIQLTVKAFGYGTRKAAVMQCQGCREYILGLIFRPMSHTSDLLYLAHYPVGKPDDAVAPEVPENIAADFREALRCRWIDAYNATVEMCRRAVQASCIEQDAPPRDKLVHQIDWLAAEGKITEPLKQMAHRIRLGGNLGAHPPEDPDAPEIVIGPEYADAVIEFTKDYFQHLYVMPKRLAKYDFRKSRSPGTTA